MPVDYSKFEDIVDSDEEREKEAAKKVTKTADPACPKASKCANCGKAQCKLRLCTACKKVAYCSTRCQKGDWQFHRRLCGSSGSSASRSSSCNDKGASKPKPSPRARRVEADDEDDDDEPLTWYKHRETKLPPSATGPVKQESHKPLEPAPAERTPSAASAWNKAGTWEERDVMPWAKEKLSSILVGTSREFGQGVIVATDVSKVEGDAAIGVIRGTARHICDLSFTVAFEARVGSHRLKGKVSVSELTQDLHDSLEFRVDLTDTKPTDIAAIVRKHLGPRSISLKANGDESPTTLAHDIALALRRDFVPAFMAL